MDSDMYAMEGFNLRKGQVLSMKIAIINVFVCLILSVQTVFDGHIDERAVGHTKQACSHRVSVLKDNLILCPSLKKMYF